MKVNLKYIILTLIVLFVELRTFADDNQVKIDSLHQVLNNSKDEERVDLLISLSELCNSSDLEMAAQFSKVASELSKELNYNKGGAISNRFLGDYYRIHSSLDTSLSAYNKSLSYYQKLNDTTKISIILNQIGMVYMELGDYSEALDFLVKSLLMMEEKSNQEGISTCYLNIGIVMQNMNEYVQALEYFNKALSYLTDENKALRGEIFMNIGKLYYITESYVEAENYYQQALINIKQSNVVKNEVKLYINMADLYYAQEDVNNAISFYQSASQLNEKNSNDLKLQAEIKIKMGNCYAKHLKQLDKGLKMIFEGFEIANKLNFKEGIKESYKSQAESYYANGNFKNAYDFGMKYLNLNDSMMNAYMKKEIQKVQSLLQMERLKLQQKIDEIDRIEEKLNDKQKSNYIIIFSSLALILLMIVRIIKLKNKIH